MGMGTEWLDDMMLMAGLQEQEMLHRLDKGIWRTRDGRERPVTQMDSEHIRNTIALLSRTQWEWAVDWINKFEGELRTRDAYAGHRAHHKEGL